MEDLYTTEEVAQYLKVAAKTVREWIGRGEIAVIDLGQGYRILQSDLDAFIERRRRSCGRKIARAKPDTEPEKQVNGLPVHPVRKTNDSSLL